MKRKVYVFLSIIFCTLLVAFSLEMPKAATYDWEFLPAGINYLDPFNFVTTTNGNDITTTETYRYIKVKPLTSYSFSAYGELNVNWTVIYFYEYNESKEELRKNIFYDFSSGINYSFTTKEETVYLVVSLEYEIYTDNIYANAIDEYFVLHESEEEINEISNEDLRYKGPINSFETASDITTIRLPYGNTTTVDALLGQIKVYDNYSGDITNSIIVELDEYTGNENVLNKYDIIFQVTDKANNESTIKIIIDVYDDVSPVITAPSTIYTNPHEFLTDEYLLSKVTVTDNYDNNLKNSIELINESYPDSSSIIGIYPVTFRVSDSSNNVSEFTMNINVRDNIAPVISGNEIIEIGNLEVLTLEEIKETLSATDDIDGEIEIEVYQDNYSKNQNKIGTYEIVFFAKDASNNYAYFTVTVKIIDSEKPVFLFDKGIINISSNAKKMSANDIILLSRNFYGINLEEDVTIIYDEYKESKEIGTRSVLFESSGKRYKLNINTVDENKKESFTNDSKKSKISIFFKNIGSFFRRIWRSIF